MTNSEVPTKHPLYNRKGAITARHLVAGKWYRLKSSNGVAIDLFKFISMVDDRHCTIERNGKTIQIELASYGLAPFTLLENPYWIPAFYVTKA